ncbi:15548_t:CDS:2 [Dentiscutata erythropus]|uniref:15548_t:CDS:1 n=1 Tax=Dentiscutata erythropus TaxID=1348616 RepID=A0A9N9BM51_9GLOM|nr:15548_t:CDS:2 [Dentiscutata erythropus]
MPELLDKVKIGAWDSTPALNNKPKILLGEDTLVNNIIKNVFYSGAHKGIETLIMPKLA